jgi:hypothetical protein
VHGKWNTAIDAIGAVVWGWETAYPSAVLGDEYVNYWSFTPNPVEGSPEEGGLYTRMGTQPLDAGSGELFRFQWSREGTPCLKGDGEMDADRSGVADVYRYTYMTDHATQTDFSDLKSPDWCEGGDAVPNSLRVVPGPNNMGDWMLVANTNQDFIQLDVQMLSVDGLVGQPSAFAMNGWTSQPSIMDRTVFTAYNAGRMDPALPAGQDHDMLWLQGENDEKPCIVQGDISRFKGLTSEELSFVSDDFCHGHGAPEDDAGDQDPGAAFGPDRLWLAYDPLVDEWTVHGAWSEQVGQIVAVVWGSDDAYKSEAMGGDYADHWWFQYSQRPEALYDGDMRVSSSMMYDPLEPGSGELFRFAWNRPGSPCLTGYYDTRGASPTSIRLPDTQTRISGVKSPDWCSGPDDF